MGVLRFALTMLVASSVAVDQVIDWAQMAGVVMVSSTVLYLEPNDNGGHFSFRYQ